MSIFKRKLSKKGVKLWPVGVSLLKSEFYNTLIPMYTPEYFKQLTAEQLVTRIHKGYPKSEWQKMRERNEALDCRIYARAAAIAIGIDRWNSKTSYKFATKINGKEETEEC